MTPQQLQRLRFNEEMNRPLTEYETKPHDSELNYYCSECDEDGVECDHEIAVTLTYVPPEDFPGYRFRPGCWCVHRHPDTCPNGHPITDDNARWSWENQRGCC